MKWYLLDEETQHTHDDIDFGTVIGTFTVRDNIITEMSEIGKITQPHLFIVYIHSCEGEIPHFHVFNKQGMHKSMNCKDSSAIHTCIEIRENRYFKHGAYLDNLNQKVLNQLDKFMSEVRTSPKYSSDIGLTNYEHTIRTWNDDNSEPGSSNWVEYDHPKPNYTILIDNL